MGRSLVRNPEVFNNGVDIRIRGVNVAYDQVYRDTVWRVFTRILNQTPQFTGRAVANWNIGVGAPDYDFDPGLGDDIEMSGAQYPIAHWRGDRKWIERAKARNRPKMARITRGMRVYINNGVMGDDDGGKSSELYMEALQESGYWLDKLRMVNKPYETAQESVIFMAEREGRLRGIGLKAGGNNMADYP